jgi:hypothetical protein
MRMPSRRRRRRRRKKKKNGMFGFDSVQSVI